MRTIVLAHSTDSMEQIMWEDSNDTLILISRPRLLLEFRYHHYILIFWDIGKPSQAF